MKTLENQKNINKSTGGKNNNLLYVAALFLSLNQGIAQHKTNNKHVQTEKTHKPITRHNTLEQSDGDNIFKTLAFTPFEADPANQNLIDIVKTVNSFQEIYALINKNPRVNKAFDKYLKESHQKISGIGNANMLGFLLSIGVAVDIYYNPLTILGTTSIDYNTIVQHFPLLSSLDVTNTEPVQIFLVSGTTNAHGISGIYGKIMITDNYNNKDSTLLNEISGELFLRYIEEIKSVSPELRSNDHIWIPNNLGDPVLDKILGPHILDEQRNEYRGDLSNLSFDPSTRLRHMLQFEIIEDGIKSLFGQSTQPEIGSYQAANYIYKNYKTYLTSKHQIGKYLLSKEFLSTIQYQKSNLWNHYQTLIQQESKKQLRNKTISEPEYVKIAAELTTIINHDPKALQKIQKRATAEKFKLDAYLNSFLKKK